MASFCSNCGFPLGAGIAFCSKCGTRHAVAAAAQPSAAPAAAPKSSSGLKILLFVLGFCVLFGVAAVGAVFYIGHRVKQAVVEKAASYGVDLPSIAQTTAAPSASRHKKACDLLSKEEAASLLGEPIERATPDESACLYFGPPGLAARLAQANTSEMMKQAQAGKELNGGDVADTVTKMMGALSGQAGPNGGEAPLLQIAYDPDGRPQMTAIEANKALFGQIPGATAEVPNLGDRAIRLGNLGLNVLKGDGFLRVLVGPVPGANDKAVAVARAIVPRM